MRRFACGLLASLTLLVGCRSPYVQATLSNRGSAPISVVELDYPSASFGVQSLAPGQDFQYRFKVLGRGTTRLTFLDARRQEHASQGPELHEGQQGTFHVTIAGENVTWQAGSLQER